MHKRLIGQLKLFREDEERNLQTKTGHTQSHYNNILQAGWAAGSDGSSQNDPYKQKNNLILSIIAI